MDKSTQKEHLAQPLQTDNKQYKIAVAFLTGYNGVFNLTNSNITLYFKKSITNALDFIQNTIPPGASEIGALNKEVKRIINIKNYYSETEYPFTIKPNFSTLGSIR